MLGMTYFSIGRPADDLYDADGQGGYRNAAAPLRGCYGVLNLRAEKSTLIVERGEDVLPGDILHLTDPADTGRVNARYRVLAGESQMPGTRFKEFPLERIGPPMDTAMYQ